jgi:predicted dehydrogenase
MNCFPMPLLKLAVVGTGRVARDNYIPYLARQSDVTLGYYNRSPAAAAELAERFGGETFLSLPALAAWEPTAVFVLTSETARCEIGSALIQLGIRRLFFEKPLGAAAGQANVAEADFFAAQAMLLAAQAAGCETAIVFNYRFFDHCVAAKAVAAERDFGSVINVAGFVHYACWSHCIDLIRFFGGNFAEITALGGTVARRSGDITTDSLDVAAAFVLENQATGTLIGTAGGNWAHPLYELILNYERGRIHLRDLDGAVEIFDHRGGWKETRAIVPHRSRWDQYRDSFDKALAAYLATLRTGAPPPIPAIAGLYELQAEAALKRSVAERRPVRVREEFPIAAPR